MKRLADLVFVRPEGAAPDPTPSALAPSDGIPTIDLDLPGPTVGDTLKAMAETAVSGEPRRPVGRPRRSAAEVFDLAMEGEPLSDAWRKNKTPTGGRGRRLPPAVRPGGRPAGAGEIEGLFATGLILLLHFGVGDWAQPTAEEATAIAAPLANILARRIDLAAKLGKDANDTIALAIAVLSYLSRVGPIAAERMREASGDRKRRRAVERVDRAGVARGPDDGDGAGDVAVGYPDPAGSFYGSAFDPKHALAKARANGRGILDRDLGPDQGQGAAVGGDG